MMIVVAVAGHGAGIVNTFFSRPDSLLIEITPDDLLVKGKVVQPPTACLSFLHSFILSLTHAHTLTHSLTHFLTVPRPPPSGVAYQFPNCADGGYDKPRDRGAPCGGGEERRRVAGEIND